VVAALVLVAAVAAVALLGGGSGAGRRAAAPTTTVPGERVIFQDDFSNSGTGWTQFDDDKARIGYSSGTYLMTVRQPGWRVYSDTELEGPAFRRDLVALGDVAIEVDADKISAPPAFYGLMCRRQQSGNKLYYAAGIDSTGRAQIVEVGGEGSPRTLADAPLAQAALTGRRHLRLECTGAAGAPVSLRLLVDGKPAVDITDPTGLGPGPAGLFVSSEAQSGSQVLFDDFAVKSRV